MRYPEDWNFAAIASVSGARDVKPAASLILLVKPRILLKPAETKVLLLYEIAYVSETIKAVWEKRGEAVSL